MTRSSSIVEATDPVLDDLEQRIADMAALQSKLILLAGKDGKTRLLCALAQRLGTAPCNVGALLARRLATIPVAERTFAAGELLRKIADSAHAAVPLLFDNLEVLFEPSLKVNPLDLVTRLAHARCVVAVWPGELRDERLTYAAPGHAEYRNYASAGMVVFEVPQRQPDMQRFNP